MIAGYILLQSCLDLGPRQINRTSHLRKGGREKGGEKKRGWKEERGREEAELPRPGSTPDKQDDSPQKEEEGGRKGGREEGKR